MLLELTPARDMAPDPAVQGHWLVTGPAPQVALGLPRGAKVDRGHYRLIARGDIDLAALAGSRLRLTASAGLGEGKTIPLRFFATGYGGAVAFVALRGPAGGLAWELVPTASRLSIPRLELRRDRVLRWSASALWAAIRGQLRAGDRPQVLLRAAWRITRNEGPGALVARIRRRLSEERGIADAAYTKWVGDFDTLGAADEERIRQKAASLPYRPLVSVVMPVHDTPADMLRAAIGSVRAQFYDRWELCIADDGSRASDVRSVLEEFAAVDSRIKIAWRPVSGHIAHASNSALALARGDWLAMLDHDDLLRPHALFCMVEALNRCPDADIVYSDEDKIDGTGRRFDPYFKPDFSIDLLYGQNYLNHLTFHRRSHVVAVGGWRPGFEGAQDYDLTLRIIERAGTDHIVHVPRVLYHWRSAAGSTARGGDEKSYASGAARRSLAEHLARTDPGATVDSVVGTPYHRVRYPLPSSPPLVSIIVPTRNGGAVLDRCLAALFRHRSYDAFEVIIVDNGSTDAATLTLLNLWSAREPRIRVLPFGAPFNFSAINNAAVEEAAGAFVCLMNDDVEAIHDEWLEEMVALAARPGVGCVGAKLHYPDGKIQHAGIVLGIGGVAGHTHKHAAGDSPGYMCDLKLARTVTAVTGACLLVRTSIYHQVGGLDQDAFGVALNDVDFCLKVRAAGYRNIWMPFARLIHHESRSRGADTTKETQARFAEERRQMLMRWGALLQEDPFYSPNLTLDREDHSLARPPRVAQAW